MSDTTNCYEKCAGFAESIKIYVDKYTSINPG